MTDLFNHFKEKKMIVNGDMRRSQRLESMKVNSPGDIGHKLSIAKIFDESTNFGAATTDVKDKEVISHQAQPSSNK